MEYVNLVFEEVYKILFLLVPVLVSVAMIVWLDRRVWAFVQKRQGPNVVGPFSLLQSLADFVCRIIKFKRYRFSSTKHLVHNSVISNVCNIFYIRFSRNKSTSF